MRIPSHIPSTAAADTRAGVAGNRRGIFPVVVVVFLRPHATTFLKVALITVHETDTRTEGDWSIADRE